MRGRVLIIAGSDSGGGAGIQADIKTVTALGGYAMTAITALTAQSTLGVYAVQQVSPAFIAQQIIVVRDDLGVDAVKTGMLGDTPAIQAVAEQLKTLAGTVPIVVDPVMVAKGGHALLAADAQTAMIRLLLPLATVLTPNLPEAEALTGMTIRTVKDMRAAAHRLRQMGPAAVLMKGGHLPGDDLTDLLVTDGGEHVFRAARLSSRHTHGTGCTLASAIACGLAQGLTMPDAVARARQFVRAAIASAPGYGQGHGPLNHAHAIAPYGGLGGGTGNTGR